MDSRMGMGTGRWRGGVWIAVIAVLSGLVGCQKTADEWADQGEALLKAYRLEEAEEAFGKALDRDPLLPRALYGMGWTHYIRRDTEVARVYFERCIATAPDYYGGYKGMGSIHLAMGFYSQAEASLLKAIELKPDEASAHSSLGYVYFLTRRLDLAEKEFLKALELEPERGEVHYLLAELRAKQGALKEALEQLDLAEKKKLEEVKFRFLALQLRGQVLLRLALKNIPAGRAPSLSKDDLSARLAMLDRAEKAFDAALEQPVVNDRIKLNRLKKKVQRAKELLSGPPPI